MGSRTDALRSQLPPALRCLRSAILDATAEYIAEHGGDGANDSADPDTEVAELAKRLRASTLSVEEVSSSASAGPSAVAGGNAPTAGGACGSAPAAGGEGAASAGAGGERAWLHGWAYWWNSSERAWNEGYCDFEADWCGADRHSIKATVWWWGTERAGWGHCEGWRLNPFYQPADVAEEQTRP